MGYPSTTMSPPRDSTPTSHPQCPTPYSSTCLTSHSHLPSASHFLPHHHHHHHTLPLPRQHRLPHPSTGPMHPEHTSNHTTSPLTLTTMESSTISETANHVGTNILPKSLTTPLMSLSYNTRVKSSLSTPLLSPKQSEPLTSRTLPPLPILHDNSEWSTMASPYNR